MAKNTLQKLFKIDDATNEKWQKIVEHYKQKHNVGKLHENHVFKELIDDYLQMLSNQKLPALHKDKSFWSKIFSIFSPEKRE